MTPPFEAPTVADLSLLKDEGVSIMKDAIMNQYQAILTGGAIVASVAGSSPLPFLMLLGAEFVVLPLIDTPPLRRWIARRKRAKEQGKSDDRRNEVVASLDKNRQSSYQKLLELCTRIESNYSGISGISQYYLLEQKEKLNQILNGCLQRLVALQKYEHFSAEQRDMRKVRTEIEGIKNQLSDTDLSERVRGALQKNLQLKQTLLQSQDEVNQTQVALAAELDSLTSLLELSYQKSLSIRDPQEISQELDAIVTQVSDTDRSIREMESLLAMGGDSLSAPINPISAISGAQPQVAAQAKRRQKNL